MDNPNNRIPATITRTSPFSGEVNKVTMNLSLADYKEWEGGKSIQDAMPYLSADDREFIMTGITSKEWEDAFGNED